jgi:hypothetical protein
MCDPRLVGSVEALTVRIEELEKKLAMMKMGVAVAPLQEQGAPPDAPAKPSDSGVTTPSSANSDAKSGGVTSVRSGVSKYADWQSVVERIAELKASLASQFIGASAYKLADKSFLVRMSVFFANHISSSSEDLAILRGVIAENEGVLPSEINVKIEGTAQSSSGSLADELENLIN